MSTAKTPSTPKARAARKSTPAEAKVKMKVVATEPAPEAEVSAVEAPPAAAPRAAAIPRSKASKAAEQRMKQARRASNMLKFISDPTRLHVITILARGEQHVGALCSDLSQSQPAVSHHLALLRHGGIITPRRHGKNNFYSLTPTGEELAGVVKNLIGTD